MIGDFKHLFSRSLGAAPGRLHFAAHSHHLWPDASLIAQTQAWADAAALADRKWGKILGEIVPQAQRAIARELRCHGQDQIVFAPNTHDLIVRLVSGLERPDGLGALRILTSDGEFHSFRRQIARWREVGAVEVETIALEPFDSFADRFLTAARANDPDLIFVSQVFFQTGQILDRLYDIAALGRIGGPCVVVDGYHGFMAIPTDWSALAGRAFYLAGGYKYAMAGEGACFLLAPPGQAPRPNITGWFADFAGLEGAQGGVAFAADARRFDGATFDPSGLYRFVAVQDMLAAEGLTTARISAHACALQDAFLEARTGGLLGALEEAIWLNPAAPSRRARFLAFRTPNASAWTRALSDCDVIVDCRDDVIRFGFGLYQDLADLDRLFQICRRVLA